MSRHYPAQISRAVWRMAVLSLALVACGVIAETLIISRQSEAISASLIFDRIDKQRTIRSGRAEADRLVLQPAAGSIGLALHPIDSPSFTLQARVDLGSPQGSGGLIVQADDAEHFTAFLISGDGYFRVGDYRNGVWIDRAAWRAWSHIRRDRSANVLRAEGGSDRCNFSVNDEWTWQDSRVLITRWIGVIAGGTEARLDQLGWQPRCATGLNRI